jgi:hypothetical protein
MQIAKSLFSELYAVALRISLNYRLPFKIFNSMSLLYRSAFLMFRLDKHRAWGDLQTPKAPKAGRPFGALSGVIFGRSISSAGRSGLGGWGDCAHVCFRGCDREYSTTNERSQHLTPQAPLTQAPSPNLHELPLKIDSH